MTNIESTKQDVNVINWRVYRYEVKFENGQECGGAYVKLLTKDTQGDLHQFMDKTPYTIMFGPDKCGLDNKVSWGYCLHCIQSFNNHVVCFSSIYFSFVVASLHLPSQEPQDWRV